MMIDINVVKLSLFFWTPQVIDLDSGEIHSVYGLEMEGRTLDNYKIIPYHSQAPIYQQYLDLLRENGVDVPEELFNWPRFEFIPRYIYDLTLLRSKESESKFIDQAYRFLEFNDYLSHDPMPNLPIPCFFQFCDDFELQFAKEWCKREGFDWYDSSGF